MADPHHTPLNGMAEYVAALDTLTEKAQRNLFVFDRNFLESGFNSVTRYDLLRRFLLSNPVNRLHLLTHNARAATQDCPRLIMLLRQFSHSMHIYQTPPHLLHLSEPFTIADELHYARRFHFDDPRGLLAVNEPDTARAFKSQFEEMWAHSRPGVTATTLGL